MSFDVRPALRERYGLTEDCCDRLFTYVEWIVGSPINLTAWSPDEIWRRGVFDALDIGRGMPQGALRALDIGSGAGFPGMVLAISRPDLDWILVDSRQRRVDFLNQVIDRLGLINVRAVAARAEQWIRQRPSERESYGVVTLRAVAPLSASIELGLPYAEVGGAVWIAHGSGANRAMAELKTFTDRLGGSVWEVVGHQEERCSVVIYKSSPTPPLYPRGANALGRPLRG